MSAYSDYKCGALTDDEYKFCARHELGEDHGELPFWDGMEGVEDEREQDDTADPGRSGRTDV